MTLSLIQILKKILDIAKLLKGIMFSFIYLSVIVLIVTLWHGNNWSPLKILKRIKVINVLGAKVELADSGNAEAEIKKIPTENEKIQN